MIEANNDESNLCDCCSFPTVKLNRAELAVSKEPHMLCDLCFSTYTGNAFEAPRNYPNQLAIMQTVCYVGNIIMDKLDQVMQRLEEVNNMTINIKREET